MANKCQICLNDQCDSGCCELSYSVLQDLVYGIKKEIARIGDNYANRLKSGYSCSPTDFEFRGNSHTRDKLNEGASLILQYKKLSQLLFALNKELKNSYFENESCVLSKTVCNLKDQALSLLGFNCLGQCRQDIMVSTEGLEQWIETNPYCVAREKWEELLYAVCDEIQVSIEVVKHACDIIFEIQQEYKNCAIDFTVDLTEKDCRIQYELLVRDVDCSITFELFKELLDCGISYNLIRTALSCGLSFDIDRTDNCPMIVTMTGTYSLCDNTEQQSEQLKNILTTFTIQ